MFAATYRCSRLRGYFVLRNRHTTKLASNRRSFLQAACLGGAAATLSPLYPALAAARDISSSTSGSQATEVKPFELDEITIADLQDGMKSGRFTARSLVEKYAARIEEIDKHGPTINS